MIIDWKYLGRDQPARNATAWCASLDGETVVIRAWGEDMTSSFEFCFTQDERLIGTLVIQVERQSDRVRVQAELEVENHISLADVTELREHAKTHVLGRPQRNVTIKQGTFPAHTLPALAPMAAEVFEISPDSALLTPAGEWIMDVLRAARDHVRVAVPVPVREGSAEPRAKTERAGARPPSPQRETIEGPGPKRAPPSAAKTPAPNGSGANDKLVCTTNTGETFDITGDETYVGRSKQCAIVLKSQRVSRKHACITREADGFYINDLGAANGIWAGSEKIDRERIKAGDQYIVGDVVLSFSYN
jgi:hypothetical protein